MSDVARGENTEKFYCLIEMGRKIESQPIKFELNEHLVGVTKEYHVRKQAGRQVAYIVEDKQTEYLLMAQRLSTLVAAINSIVKEKPDQVSTTGLYEIIRSKGNARGFYTKHRWKVTPCDLKDAVMNFEGARERGFAHAVVIGEPHCYQKHICV